MATHQVWIWHESGTAFAEIEGHPDLLFKASDALDSKDALLDAIRDAIDDPDPHFDVTFTDRSKREALKLNGDAPFLDPETIRPLCDRFGLSEHADDLVQQARPTIVMHPRILCAGEPRPVGMSIMGGDPDLPEGFVWPTSQGRPLSFMAQFRLSELPAFPAEQQAQLALPRSGYLWFWYDFIESPWWTKPDEPDPGCRVSFIPDESTPLVRTAPPAELERLLGYDFQQCLPMCRPALSVPDVPEDASDDCFHEWYDLVAALYGDRGDSPHRLRGYADDINDDTLAEDPEAELLAEFNTDTKRIGWGVGDCGSLRFYMKRADLEARRFENAWTVVATT